MPASKESNNLETLDKDKQNVTMSTSLGRFGDLFFSPFFMWVMLHSQQVLLRGGGE